MKMALNLQALRRSKVRKDNTIYGKAHRIMMNKFETPIIDDSTVEELAKKFPTLSVKRVMGGDIMIRSIKDTWMIIDEGRFYTLYHQNNQVVRGKNCHRFHLQDIFTDLNYIFASIVSHDEYALRRKKWDHRDLEDMYAS